MRIGLLSDTHGHVDPKIYNYFSECDEIWHAGDFGNMQVIDELKKFKPLRAVYGNIDDHKIRLVFPLNSLFICEGLKVFITHIGGYPGHYSPAAKQMILSERPGLFICGHSHILKVMPDKNFNLLHMNPGAAGNYGFHKIKTLLRFTVQKAKVKDVEVIELGLRGSPE
jgi:uncharacterized protein